MGALLSLPLLALPSAGTVGLFPGASIEHQLTYPATHLRRIMLRSSDMLSSMQRMRQVPEQVCMETHAQGPCGD